jgi:hypothetical protein
MDEAKLRLTLYSTASDFLRDVHEYLARHEAANGLMLGLALRLVHERPAYGSTPPYFAAVFDETRPRLAALMTPPHNLILYSHEADAVESLEWVARDLLAWGWPVAGVTGPVHLSGAFSDVWSRLTGAAKRQGMSQRIYEVRRVIAPRWSRGRLRRATEADADLVVAWTEEFHREAVPGGPVPLSEMSRRRITEGSVFLWDDGGPVSMALKTRPTQHGITVGAVYTPVEYRRRGYATSCVAALSQQLLDAGFEYCTLFTDLSNPTSNAIYQRIGYRPVCDFQEIMLALPSP